jgi:hypothetical protein
MFSTDFISGDPTGSDDIGEVKWFKLSDVPKMIEQKLTADEHTPHLTALINTYISK